MADIRRRQFVKKVATAVAVSGLAAKASGEREVQTPVCISIPSFPSATIAGVPLPRLIIGTNSFLGFSHTSLGRDRWIRRFYTPERIADVFIRCLELGLTAVFGPCYAPLLSALDTVEKRTGVRLTFIGTTFGDPAIIRDQIKQLKEAGAKFCLLHGGWADSFPLRTDASRTLTASFFLSFAKQGLSPALPAIKPTDCNPLSRAIATAKSSPCLSTRWAFT